MIHLLPIFGNKATEIVVYYSVPSGGGDKILLRVLMSNKWNISIFFLFLHMDKEIPALWLVISTTINERVPNIQWYLTTNMHTMCCDKNAYNICIFYPLLVRWIRFK